MIPFHNHDQQVRFETNESKKCSFAPKAERTTISFFPSVHIHSILHINDYTDAEIQECWYTMQELRALKKEIRYSINLIEEGGLWDETKHCKRGLEPKIRKLAHASSLRKRQARRAVLQEQLVQRNDYEIARKYKQYSYKSKMTAYMLGVADAKAARYESKEMEDHNSSNSLQSIQLDPLQLSEQILSVGA
jgi:hypothetical protein